MQIETYELKDVREETIEQCDEAKKLIEELGLAGQQELQTGTTTQTRFPYRIMTDEEQFVFQQLCPERCEACAFRNEPMPLEILKTFAFAKSLGAFTYFEVWAASSARVKDPVLIGYKQRYREPYILARWGAELLPLEVLLPDAVKVWYNKYKQKIAHAKQDIEACANLPIPDGVPDASVYKTGFYA